MWLWVLVFLLTVAECFLAVQGNRAERRAIRPRGRLSHSFEAAGWALLFELVLWGGIVLVATEDRWLVVPAAVGAAVGTVWSTEISRRRLNRKREKRAQP